MCASGRPAPGIETQLELLALADLADTPVGDRLALAHFKLSSSVSLIALASASRASGPSALRSGGALRDGLSAYGRLA